MASKTKSKQNHRAPSPKLSPEDIQQIEKIVFELVDQALESPYYLVDVEFIRETGYWYLRIYVDTPQHDIALDDCERISRQLDTLLEAKLEGFQCLLHCAYNIEISSPGLFRELKTPREFAFYLNTPVRLDWTDTKESVEGTLTQFDAETQAVSIQPANQSKPIQIVYQPQTMRLTLNPTLNPLTEGESRS